MKKMFIILVFLIVIMPVSVFAQNKLADFVYTENITWSKVQHERLSKLVHFIKSNNIKYYSLNQSGQNIVGVRPNLAWGRVKLLDEKQPCIQFHKHPLMNNNRKGAYVFGKLKGSLGYKKANYKFDISGHTFSFIFKKNKHQKNNKYLALTSLKLFSHPSQIIQEYGMHINISQTYVIPFSEIKKLPQQQNKKFNRLFYDLQGGRK